MKIAVAQLGARMHYAVPSIAYQAGILERFYTDLSASATWARPLAVMPRRWRADSLERLAGRSLPIPKSHVTAFPGLGLAYALRRRLARTASQTTGAYLWAGRTLCARVLKAGLGNASAVYTFNSAGLELLRTARHRGLRAIMEQTIAPRECEIALLEQEHGAHPGWEPSSSRDNRQSEFIDRERNEWSAADLIICGSEFVQKSIVQIGGPAGRCIVVPYGVNSPDITRASRTGPLRVLTVGAVGLRKGAPYLLGAARLLHHGVIFRAVGPISASPAARRDLQSVVQLTGAIPRSEVFDHYRWGDVFLLPSVCEGSATVCYEALAAGLPVITTPNAGSVVRDGIDGFIVPIRDPEAIAEKLELLARDRELLGWMSANALARSREFTLEKYGERLVGAIRQAYANHHAA